MIELANTDKISRKRLLSKRIFSYSIFWSWNIIFVIFVFSVIVPYVLPEIYKDTVRGIIPFDFSLYATLLIIIPIIVIILGVGKLRKFPNKLVHLFYGIEVPLCLIFLLRLFLFRELNPGTIHLLIVFVTGIIIYFYDIVWQPAFRNHFINLVQLIGHSMLFLIGIYISVILFFYVIPLISLIFIEFFKFEWFTNILDIIKDILSGDIQIVFIGFVSILFFAYTATIFIGLPLALVILYTRSFIGKFKTFAKKYSSSLALTVSLVVIILNIGVYFVTNRQPQQKTFEALENKQFTNGQIADLLKNQNRIRKGLLNAYLSPYRYLSSVQENNHIAKIYKDVFGMNEDMASVIQNFNNKFMKPFLYNGDRMSRDQNKAEDLYEFFFDIPIQRAEGKAIKHAMESTWDRDGIEAGLLNINEEKVLISEQSVNIKEFDNHAEVEIYESYVNKTSRTQEILYYFYLPDNAVITGMWLSDEADVDKKYSYSVSPRGAAQQVYKRQLIRRADPSLLEQVGPCQYRLRAFPVLPNPSDEFEENETEYFRLWFCYECFPNKNNAWPMPQLLEKRNVYWSSDTKFTFNGEEKTKNISDNWLPEKIEASKPYPDKDFNVLINDKYMISSLKLGVNVNDKPNGKIAVLLDPSYSMNNVKDSLLYALKTLKEKNIDADLYRIENSIMQAVSFNSFELSKNFFFGKNNLYSLMKLYQNKASNKNYKALVVLTDKGSYELSKDSLEALSFEYPVYLVHLDLLPSSYEDALLETVQKSGGDVATTIDKVLKILSIKQNFVIDDNTILDFENQRIWKIDTTQAENVNIDTDKNMEALAAKQFINKFIRQSEKLDLEKLDTLHAIAKKYSIVSPYSSMIVLVNNEQRKQLKELEYKKDRYEREVETGKEILSTPSNPATVSGVPEPEEWILIGITFLLLLIFFVKKKYKF